MTPAPAATGQNCLYNHQYRCHLRKPHSRALHTRPCLPTGQLHALRPAWPKQPASCLTMHSRHRHAALLWTGHLQHTTLHRSAASSDPPPQVGFWLGYGAIGVTARHSAASRPSHASHPPAGGTLLADTPPLASRNPGSSALSRLPGGQRLHVHTRPCGHASAASELAPSAPAARPPTLPDTPPDSAA